MNTKLQRHTQNVKHTMNIWNVSPGLNLLEKINSVSTEIDRTTCVCLYHLLQCSSAVFHVLTIQVLDMSNCDHVWVRTRVYYTSCKPPAYYTNSAIRNAISFERMFQQWRIPSFQTGIVSFCWLSYLSRFYLDIGVRWVNSIMIIRCTTIYSFASRIYIYIYIYIYTELILGLRPANERRRYKVEPSLIGWAQT